MQVVEEKLRVGGMTCASCEKRIGKKLRSAAGVQRARADYKSGLLDVAYDSEATSRQEIGRILGRLGYELLPDTDGTAGLLSPQNQRMAGLVVLIIAIFVLLQLVGANSLFTAVPLAEEGMGYAMLALIGVLTSVHCIGMCGGITLTQCLPTNGDSPERHSGPDPESIFAGRSKTDSRLRGNDGVDPRSPKSSHKNESQLSTFNFQLSTRAKAILRPSLYNLGRVISYTLIGACVGALGAVISFPGAMRGIVQLIAGLFMVVMGLNMLGIFPWLKQFGIQLPQGLTRRVDALAGRSSSPLFIGLLNGLMPCGPLQAMQLYAFSTGSALGGALSMLFFCLGTVPLMFALGAAGSLLGRRFTAKAMTAGAVLVCVLGLVMFSNGLALSGFGGGGLAAATSAREQPAVAVVQGDVQVLESTLERGSYPSITVAAGIPVRWTINAAAEAINGCNRTMVIPEYGLQHEFAPGENVLEFTPTQAGTYRYSCWMGMIRGTITVTKEGA